MNDARVSGLSRRLSSDVRVAGRYGPPEGFGRYTAFIGRDPLGFPEEEIDLDVRRGTSEAAMAKHVWDVLATDYEPGLKLLRIEERFGLYL